MEHYRNARQVRLKAKRAGLKLTPLDRDEGGKSKVSKEELTYVHPSPNFCQRNMTAGVEGTRGRECNELSKGDDGCEVLCCGRGYYAKRTVRLEKCRCRFVWCCKVVCDECITATETFICNQLAEPNDGTCKPKVDLKLNELLKIYPSNSPSLFAYSASSQQLGQL